MAYEDERFRDFILCQMGGTVFEKLRQVQPCIRVKNDKGFPCFAPFGIGYPDDGGGGNIGMGGKYALYFCRIDVFPTGDKHIFDAVHYIQVLLIVHAHHIPAVVPPVANGTCGSFRVTPIPGRDHRTFQE